LWLPCSGALPLLFCCERLQKQKQMDCALLLTARSLYQRGCVMANLGQVAVGIILLVVVVGGLLFIFYSRTNAVEKTGYGSLIMLALVSLMIPVFWISEGNNQAVANVQQWNTAVQQGMQIYAQYCTDQCYAIVNGKISNPAYNGYTVDEMNAMSDNDLNRMISAGIYNPKAPHQPTSSNSVQTSDKYGGALDSNMEQYLFSFLRSADPEYLRKNGYPNVNGFDQLPEYLQNNNPTQYQAAVNLGKENPTFGALVDLTNQKTISIDIVNVKAASGFNCTSQVACFNQPNIKVKVGTVITWTNKDSVAHTVTAIKGSDTANPQNNIDSQVFDSGAAGIQSGKSFSYTVTNAAYSLNPNHTVIYYCRFHPDMLAQLTIVQ
jgi:plastocyanin